MNVSYGVIGGDRRQAELVRLLRSDGKKTITYGLGRWLSGEIGSLEAAAADVVVLPLPLCRADGVLNCEGEKLSLQELLARFRPDQKILAGQIGETQRRAAEERSIRLIDYFAREELTVANAAATAEAAIQVAMEQSDRTLLGMPCLVLGFGRIGKLLSHRLHGIGVDVTATARKPEDLAWIRAYGYRALRTDALENRLSGFGLIFNTIPSLVLNDALLSQLPEDCICIELASRPGIDPEAAKERGLRLVSARGLPGRMVPCSAAEIIRDTVYHILSEE